MLKGFKDFILRGNVVELATAVIVGAAFTGIVTAFTKGIINPLLAAIPTGSGDCAPATPASGDAVNAPVSVCGLGFKVTDNNATFLDFGGLIAAIINFLIVAAVVYFIIIVPYNKLASLGRKPNEAEVTEISLLTEIRDFLSPDDSGSAAREQAESVLPPHLSDPSGPPTGGPGDGPTGPDDTSTRQFSTPPPSPSAPPAPSSHSAPGSYSDPGPYSGPIAYSDPAPSGPLATPEHPGQAPETAPYPGPGAPTPSPAPGNYPPPPPGNYPPPPGGQPGNYPPPGNHPPANYPNPRPGQPYPGEQYPGDQYPGEQYPGEHPPEGPGRHSR
ncbi:MscL family protein [Gordonia sp. DT219]|uniref:large conductance mechanosensitive channel protein MscL n=1 Tax=Gordonia sp. DT219 TaxID=3416658 RepID=UPI003CF91E33